MNYIVRHILLKIWATIAFVMVLGSTTPAIAQYNREYFLWIARRDMTRGEYHEAIASINALLRVDDREYEGYFLRAIAKYNMGDFIGADSDFSSAIERNPVYTMAYTYRAITRSRLGNYDDALKDFEMAIELRPDIPSPYYSRGVTRLLNQQFKEAIADFDQFIRQERRYADAYIYRGASYLQLRDTIQAIANFDEAIRTNYRSPDGYSHRGALYLKQERYQEAKEDFDMAIKNDSTHIPSRFNRALAYNNLNAPIEAIKDLDQVIRLDSMSSITHFNRAIIKSRIGDYNAALKDYNRVAELSPENVLVYFYRANLLSRLGEIERAKDDYSRAIELYPDFANAYIARSNIRMLLQDSKGSLRDKSIAEQKIAEHKSKLRDSSYSIYSDTTYQFDRLLSFDTKLSGSSFNNNSRRLSGAGEDGDLRLIPLFRFTLQKEDEKSITHRKYYDEQMEQFISSIDAKRLTIDHKVGDIPADSLAQMESRFEQASLVEQDRWDDLFRLGVVQSAIKQYTSAITTLSEAIQRSESQEEESPFLLINRAATRAEMIEFINSIESSFQRISIGSNTTSGLGNGGNSAKKVYDYREAMADIDRAIELHPDLAYSHYNRANLLVLSGDLPEAYIAYSTAINLYPAFGEAYYNRGIVQIMMKDDNKGLIDLSKAGELGVEGAYKLLGRYSR